MSIVIREILTGLSTSIHAMGSDKECPVLDFLDALQTNDADEYGKIWSLLERTKDHGTPRNEQKCRFFKKEQIFEFKTTGGVRIMAFWDKNRMIICSHGFMKKSNKTPNNQITKAVASKETYFKAKSQGSMIFDS